MEIVINKKKNLFFYYRFFFSSSNLFIVVVGLYSFCKVLLFGLNQHVSIPAFIPPWMSVVRLSPINNILSLSLFSNFSNRILKNSIFGFPIPISPDVKIDDIYGFNFSFLILLSAAILGPLLAMDIS